MDEKQNKNSNTRQKTNKKSIVLLKYYTLAFLKKKSNLEKAWKAINKVLGKQDCHLKRN